MFTDDDIKLYRVVNCYKCDELLQSDLNLFFNWYKKKIVLRFIFKNF